MRNRWPRLGLLALAGLVAACARRPSPTPALGLATPRPLDRNVVVASGQVLPATRCDLSFTLAGRVESVAIAEGNAVAVGDPLAALESETLRAALARAEAGVAAAEAALARLEAGSRPQERTLAETRVAAAEAALAGAKVAAARPDLGATQSELEAAQANLTAAQADERAAYEAHQATLRCIHFSGPSGEKELFCPALGPIEEQARLGWEVAQAARAAAEARLRALHAASGAERAIAQARVALAAAQREAALAQLRLVRSQARAEEAAAARAALVQAQAEVATAHAALDQATLRAPCAGVVASVGVQPGEVVAPGQVVVTVATLDQLQVETTDLSERDVARVAVGARAAVYVEALGETIKGEVVRIADQATSVGGDAVYTVVIALRAQPAGLRWGMTADVEIEAAP